jgi:hypothetical protein
MWSCLGMLACLALRPIMSESETRIDQIGWIAGHWSVESRGRTIEEHWMRPAGKTMIGMGRTVRGDKTVEFEYLQIRMEGEDLVYAAQPNGGSPTQFRLVRSGPGEAVFENLKHDFPQRIIYRKQPDGSVHARIEGEADGKVRAVDFPYRRAKCAADER